MPASQGMKEAFYRVFGNHSRPAEFVARPTRELSTMPSVRRDPSHHGQGRTSAAQVASSRPVIRDAMARQTPPRNPHSP